MHRGIVKVNKTAQRESVLITTRVMLIKDRRWFELGDRRWFELEINNLCFIYKLSTTRCHCLLFEKLLKCEERIDDSSSGKHQLAIKCYC